MYYYINYIATLIMMAIISCILYFSLYCTLVFAFCNCLPHNDIFPHFEAQLEVIALPRQCLCDNDL